MPSPKVIVVGSIMQDLTFSCPAFPTSGQTVMGRLAAGQGGKGSNQAIACGRTGMPTLFVGATGQDSFSQKVRAFYRKDKIGCHLATKKNHETGTAVILIDPAGQNEIVIEPGANAQLKPSDIPKTAWRGAEVLLVQLEANLATTTHALRTARRAGITTILNPAPMRADFDHSLLKYVDILIPNESEFVALIRQIPALNLPHFDERALHALPDGAMHDLCRKCGVSTVIVTLGSKGCLVSEATGFVFLPAHQNVTVVDTTGAGDAFCGGFAAGWVRYGQDCAAAARLGSAVAALSITKAGAAAAMPSLKALKQFLRTKNPTANASSASPRADQLNPALAAAM